MGPVLTMAAGLLHSPTNGQDRLMAVETSVRMLMALFVGPLNAAQLARVARTTIDAVRPRVREMVRLGVVEDDRCERFQEYRLLPRGGGC